MARPIKMMMRNARIVARRYKRLCWWASEEDVAGDAFTAQLSALSRAQPGSPLIRYTWQIAVNAASASVKRESSPVSCLGDPNYLVDFRRAPLPREASDATAPVQAIPRQLISHDTPHELYEEKVRVERIRERIRFLLGDDSLPFAIDMLLGEFKPGEVAVTHSIPVASVYRTVQRIRNTLSSDPVLFELWRNT